MAANQQFQHTRLSDPSHHFRIVAVEPRNYEGLIQCKISTLSLEACPNSYHALSYLWGAETPTYSIHINGQTFQVRENLWHFLEHARSRFSNVPFFIDAICIDQTNLAERNQQVQMMGDIYSNSQLTVAWLGQGNAEVDRALPFIHDISNLTPYELQHYYDGHDRRQRQRAWSSVYLLCDLRYWSRVWIVQEVLKPRQILLLYGRHELPWTQLSHFLYSVRTTDPCPAPLLDELLSCRMVKLDGTRDLSSNGKAYGSMTDVLLEYCSSHCSEKKDRVFALLSLGIGGAKLKVDYSMHPCDLFIEAIRLWGAQSGDNALILAKHLADALLPLPADYAGQEQGLCTFAVKLIDSQLVGQHSGCSSTGACLSSEHSIRSHGYASYSDTNSMQNYGMTGLGGVSVTMASARSFGASSAVLQLGSVRHSQLQCQDKVLQIEDTNMFIVARLVEGSLKIVARLGVVVDEVDHTSHIVSTWLPWSKALADLCELTTNVPGQYHIFFNAYSLRRFLVLVCYDRSQVELRSEQDVYALRYESLRWADEPEGSQPISAICRLQALYYDRYIRGKADNMFAGQQDMLTTAQAHQALKTSKLNFPSPDDFKPTPSWKDLLGRK